MRDNTVRAGEYVLGVLAPEERLAVEREAAADPALAAEIAFWSERFLPLVDGMEVEPPADLFARIKRVINDELPGTTTVRADAGHWERIGRGIERRILHTTAAGRCMYLIRGQPGARLPEHDHDDDEEIYVVEGDLTIGPVTLHAGDYHVARRGSRHPAASSQNGCLLLMTSLAA